MTTPTLAAVVEELKERLAHRSLPEHPRTTRDKTEQLCCDALNALTAAEAQNARLREALKAYVDECTNEECEFCIRARAALQETDQ